MSKMKDPLVIEIFCILTMSMSTFWLCYFTIALQDVVIAKNWVQDIMNHCFSYKYNVHIHLSQNKRFNLKSRHRLLSHRSAANIQNVQAQF